MVRFSSPSPQKPFGGDQVKRWFDHALGRTFKRRPSAEAYESIATEIRALICQIIDEDLPVEKRRGVSGDQIISELLIDVKSHARDLLISIEKLKDYAGQWTKENSGLALDELENALHSISASGFSKISPKLGRRPARWIPFGRRFANLVREALVNVAYEGNVEETDAASKTAEIGAAMVSYVIGGKGVSRETFAAQMAGDRKSRGESQSLFPHANRLDKRPK